MSGNGWRPRLVALAVDGTLLKAGDTIRTQVRAAVRSAARQAHVVLATGRSVEETAQVVEHLGLTGGYAVCSNGAVLARCPDLMIEQALTFSPREVIELVLGQFPDAIVAVEEPGFGYGVTKYFPDGELLGPQRVRRLSEMLTRQVTRVIVRDPSSTVDEFADRVAGIGIRGVSYAIGYRAWLDLGPQGVSKGGTLARLAGSLDVDAADCLAIGDGRNDVEMLAWAGRGVAMGQAPAEVRAVANSVTSSVEFLGAAEELCRWFASEAPEEWLRVDRLGRTDN